MSFPRFDKFLCVLKLEIAGIFFGWTSLIGYGLSFCLMSGIAMYWLILVTIFQPLQDKTTFFESLINTLTLENYYLKLQFLSSVSDLKLNWVYIIYLLFCFFMAISGLKMIRGTKAVSREQRNFYNISFYQYFYSARSSKFANVFGLHGCRFCIFSNYSRHGVTLLLDQHYLRNIDRDC